ncbi:MAG: phage major capsid protein [Hydrogenophaga sp.]|uniref:phage major capsid protein n=1 Tax=Hydrogenophaga sp. TaxID=1904254 RepID=UPI002716A17D|nr:phage major capsid protein [Hydrogenophaga sp.]MDO9029758.1 phage major capsid protein [Hydrogenophaga sp.]
MLASEKIEVRHLMEDVLKGLNTEFKGYTERTSEKMAELGDRLVAIEQRRMGDDGAPHGTSKGETLSDFVMKSSNLKAMLDGSGKSCRIDLPPGMLSASKAAIVTDGQVLSPAMRIPGIVHNAMRMTRVRDLLPIGTTGQNMVEFTRENVFTNNAGPQYASPATENVTKPESGITFTLEEAPVRTLAHWIPVSRQVLADSQQMAGYLNNRLMHGLKVKEDLQILSGDGTGANLKGILATGQHVAAPSYVSGDTRLDTILRVFAALAEDELVPDGVLLHPQDWTAMQLTKDDNKQYLLGRPGSATAPSLWGVPIVASTAISEGTFCVGSFAMGAQVWDREQASVQISYEDGNNFVKNMATVLCEERLALTVYRPKAFRVGTF